MLALATYGVGMLIGFSVVGAVSNRFLVNNQHDWFQIWIYPAGFAAVVMVLFTPLFKNEVISYSAKG